MKIKMKNINEDSFVLGMGLGIIFGLISVVLIAVSW